MKDDELYLLTYFSNPDDTFSEKLIMSIDKYTTQVKLMSDSTFIFGGTGAAKTSHIDTMFTNFQNHGRTRLTLLKINFSKNLTDICRIHATGAGQSV